MGTQDLECTDKGCYIKNNDKASKNRCKLSKKTCQWRKTIHKFKLSDNSDSEDSHPEYAFMGYGISKYSNNK